MNKSSSHEYSSAKMFAGKEDRVGDLEPTELLRSYWEASP